MTNIYLDIETIPGQQEWLKDEILSTTSAPANYKDPEKIADYIKEAAESALLKTSFDGAYGHIICISHAFDNEEPYVASAESVEEEKELIKAFYFYLSARPEQAYTRRNFIGHNIQGFDLPFLKKRSMVLGIEPPAFIPFNSKPWDANPFDTMMQWDAKNYASLDKLCKAFGIEGKGDVDGSQVYQMWKDGKHQEIRDYCASDVVKVRQLYKRMTYAA